MTHTLKRAANSSEDAPTELGPCPECFSTNSFQREAIIEPVTDGVNTALVHVDASVCNVCGYALVDMEGARKIEDAHARLKRGDVGSMTAVGVTYQA